MKNFKLILQYDGTNYHGWQIQPNAVTVQQTVCEAIKKLTGENITLVGAGRTDSGVHAINYSANFRSNTTIPAEKLPYALNTKLPQDIICKHAETVPYEFHASNSAVKKTYIYRILNSQYDDAFQNRYSWHYKYFLDDNIMDTAAKHFIGVHDFAGFCSSGFSAQTTVREIYNLTVTRSGDIITISVTGNGFLYNMVRIITGTLVNVGIGKIRPEDMPDIIKSCDRKRAGITAPAKGLFLSEVFY